MGDHSKIEWTDASWNPIRARNKATGKVGWHCEHATTGCEHCYSEGFNKRLGTGLAFKPGHRKDIEIFLDEQMLTQPLRWKKPRRIFVCSMTDAFADFVTDEMLDKMFAVMALCPQHTFQVLTKRAPRMRRYMLPTTEIPMLGRLPLERVHLAAAAADDACETWGWCRNRAMAATPYNLYLQAAWPLPNVWLGVSAERQQEAEERIPDLRATPAAVRFVSLEPLLGPIDLLAADDYAFGTLKVRLPKKMPDIHPPISGTSTLGEAVTSLGGSMEPMNDGLDWVIVGGESGAGARPMHPAWARSLREQCAAASIAFFFKQWGRHVPFQGEMETFGAGAGVNYFHPTKKSDAKTAVGRLLDGVEHSEFPKVPA